jgi:hypothetical protein
MKTSTLLLVVCVVLGLCGCGDDPRASLEITSVRAMRVSDVDRRVVVDVDSEASEGLGGSIGYYCVSVLFPFSEDYVDQCGSDLQDGDTRSFSFVSERADLPGGSNIRVQARVGKKQTGLEDLPTPP